MVVGTTASGQPVYLYEVVRLEPAGGPTKDAAHQSPAHPSR